MLKYYLVKGILLFYYRLNIIVYFVYLFRFQIDQ